MEQGGRMQELDVVQGVHNLEQAPDGMAQAHGKLAQDGMVLAHGAVLGRDVEHDVVQEQEVAHTDLDDRVYGDSLFVEVPLFVLLRQEAYPLVGPSLLPLLVHRFPLHRPHSILIYSLGILGSYPPSAHLQHP